MSSTTVSTKDLKRVLGFWDLMSTAIGQIIGSGIMSLTGIAIAMCGHAVPVAFILSAVFTIILAIPQVILSGTVRLRGGQYTMTAMLAGQKYAGVFVILHVLQRIAIAMYAISFADYMLAFLPQWNRDLIAFVCLTVFFLLNLFGIDKMAKAQNLIVFMMCAALALFSAFGFSEVHFEYFKLSTLLDNGGVMGVFSAAALLTFATGGASAITNLGAEAKNARRDIPVVIIVSTLAVTVLYAFMSVIAAGVLPLERVANQPLTWVALEILPTPLYVFFIVGGCMFALISTLNAELAWATKPILQACVDGWFPAKLGEVNKKFKTPHWILIIIYIVGLVPIFFKVNVGIIGSLTVIINQVILLIINVFIYKLPQIAPKEWENSKFKVGKTALVFIIIGTVATNLLQIYLLGKDLSVPMMIGNVVMLIFAFVFSFMREKSGKVNIEISYEAD